MMRHLIIFVILSVLARSVHSACPFGCVCDEENLHVNCLNANLDVVPITLNPAVQKMNLRGNRIKSVETGFSFYHQLSYLDLSHNHLVRISPGSFTSQSKLVQLNLEHNKISELPNRTFTGQMTSLTILNLRDNLIDVIEPGLFASMSSLEELDISMNSIKTLWRGAFTGLTSLRLLKIENNELSRVPEVFDSRGGVTPTFPRLAELSLAANPIEKIVGDAFGSVRNLVTLDLRGCRISAIELNAFRGLSQLRKLFLSDNLLARVPTLSFPPLPQVEILKLGKNPIEQLEGRAFGGLRALKIIEMGGMNELVVVNEATFSANLDLETVELSNSKKLLLLPGQLFKGLSSLKHLNIKENGLSSIPEDLASWQSLRSIHIDGNPLRCVCELLWLRDLFNDLGRFRFFRNASKFVTCDSPKELKGKRVASLEDKDLNCGMSGPFHKTIIGVCIGLTVIFLMVFFILLYRNHDRIKSACKRRRLTASARRKARNAVISSGKELDTKNSFLQPYPNGGGGLHSDEEYAVRASLMASSPPPHPPGGGASFLHHPAHFHPALHSHYHSSNLNYPSNYNEYDTPIHNLQRHQLLNNGGNSYPTLQSLHNGGYHPQFPLGVHSPPIPPSKPIPITEL